MHLWCASHCTYNTFCCLDLPLFRLWPHRILWSNQRISPPAKLHPPHYGVHVAYALVHFDCHLHPGQTPADSSGMSGLISGAEVPEIDLKQEKRKTSLRTSSLFLYHLFSAETKKKDWWDGCPALRGAPRSVRCVRGSVCLSLTHMLALIWQ